MGDREAIFRLLYESLKPFLADLIFIEQVLVTNFMKAGEVFEGDLVAVLFYS